MALTAMLAVTIVALPALGHTPDGSDDVTASTTTDPAGAEVHVKLVGLPNEGACGAVDSSAEHEFKSEGGLGDVADNVQFTDPETGAVLTVDGNKHDGYTVTLQGGSMADILLKSNRDNHNWYHFHPSVSSATPLFTGTHAGLSHITICYDVIGTLQVTKFIDANEDGIANDGPADAGDLEGWTFSVTDEDSVEVCSLSTDATGMASCDLPAGTYTVTETNDGDPLSSNGATTIVTTDNLQLVGVVSGDTSEVEFGNTCVITKHFEVSGLPTTGIDTVVVNYSGTHSGSVDLADPENDGTWTGTAGDTFVDGDTLTWTTSVNGATAQTGGSETFDATANGYNGTDGDCEKTNTQQLDPPDIDVLKAKDADGDGNPLDSDDGLEGWTIQLKQNGVVQDTDVTDANGAASFDDLAPGTYTVCEVLQADWEQTFPVDGDGDPICHEVTVDFDNDGNVKFLNAPLSEIRVGFTDLTGFTNAKIECTDANGDVVFTYDSTSNPLEDPGAEVFDDEAIVKLSQSIIDCTFEIIDP